MIKIESETIIAAIAECFQMTSDQFTARRRRSDGDIRNAQIICWKILSDYDRKEKRVTLVDLAVIFNKANHTSIHHGIDLYDNEMKYSKSFRDLVQEVMEFVKEKTKPNETGEDKLSSTDGLPVADAGNRQHELGSTVRRSDKRQAC